MDHVYEFDVDVSTHDLLRVGVVVADRRRVEIAGSSYLDASLAALQLACVDGALPTDLRWRY